MILNLKNNPNTFHSFCRCYYQRSSADVLGHTGLTSYPKYALIALKRGFYFLPTSAPEFSHTRQSDFQSMVDYSLGLGEGLGGGRITVYYSYLIISKAHNCYLSAWQEETALAHQVNLTGFGMSSTSSIDKILY